MPCDTKTKHDTALGMYNSIGYSITEYNDMMKKVIKKPGFTSDLFMYHPYTVTENMAQFRAMLAKKYFPQDPMTPMAAPMQHMPDHATSGTLYHKNRIHVLQGIKEAADYALLEFKMAVVDYIKQDGIKPGCLPSKERAVLYLVDQYFQQLAQKAVMEELISRQVLEGITIANKKKKN